MRIKLSPNAHETARGNGIMHFPWPSSLWCPALGVVVPSPVDHGHAELLLSQSCLKPAAVPSYLPGRPDSLFLRSACTYNLTPPHPLQQQRAGPISAPVMRRQVQGRPSPALPARCAADRR